MRDFDHVETDVGGQGKSASVKELRNGEFPSIDCENAEDKTISAQKQFVAAIECVSDGFALFDADDRMVFCNSRFKQMNPDLAPKLVPGVSFEELLRDNISANRILDALGDEEAFIRRRMEQHRNPSGPLVQQRRDGRWLELREERTPEGSTFLVNTDITERKCAEDALRESEERFRDIAELAGNWIWEMGPDLRLTYLSGQCEQFTGMKAEVFLGKTRQELIANDPNDPSLRRHLEDLEARRPFRDFEYTFVSASGERLYFRINGKPMFDAAGRFQGYRGSGANITERKRVQEALAQLKHQNDLILRSAGEGIYGLDTQGQTTFINPAALKMIGWEVEDLIGKPQHDILHHTKPDGRPYPREECPIYAAFRDGSVHHASDEVFWRKDGSSFPVEYVSAPIRERGEIIGAVVVFRDISDQKRAEEAMLVAREQAEGANRIKSEFLANMSHELRTPLNAIIGFSEIIKGETFGPIGSSQYLEYAGDINESGQHLLDLINDILDLSKVESGTDELREEIIEIPEIIRSILILVRGRAQKGNVQLELDVPDDAPALLADQRKLKQILINLLSNAIKFTLAGGKVTLRAWSRAESGYVFQVIDTGIGIAFKDIPKALAPFQQIDSQLDRKFEGTGLGLPLSKSLIEMHGGSLDLQSQAGVGTTVTVRFPAERIVRLQQDRKAVCTADRKAG
jgi:PAS domain S-box-containing protein